MEKILVIMEKILVKMGKVEKMGKILAILEKIIVLLQPLRAQEWCCNIIWLDPKTLCYLD